MNDRCWQMYWGLVVGQFTGKTVLITGASYGLGEGFAEAFAKEGADLVLTARSVDMLEAVAQKCRQLGSKVTVAPGDVSVEEDVIRVVEAGIKDHGKIDVLINNAGVSDLRGVSAVRRRAGGWHRRAARPGGYDDAHVDESGRALGRRAAPCVSAVFHVGMGTDRAVGRTGRGTRTGRRGSRRDVARAELRTGGGAGVSRASDAEHRHVVASVGHGRQTSGCWSGSDDRQFSARRFRGKCVRRIRR